MAERTSLDRQIASVHMFARNSTDPALRDALNTLCELRRIEHALQREDGPDTNEVTKLMENLLLPGIQADQPVQDGDI